MKVGYPFFRKTNINIGEYLFFANELRASFVLLSRCKILICNWRVNKWVQKQKFGLKR